MERKAEDRWEAARKAAEKVHVAYRRKLAPFQGRALAVGSKDLGQYSTLVTEYAAIVRDVYASRGFTEAPPAKTDTPAKLLAWIDRRLAGVELAGLVARQAGTDAASEAAGRERVFCEARRTAVHDRCQPMPPHDVRDLAALQLWCLNGQMGIHKEPPAVAATLRLTVDLAKMTVTLYGTPFDVSSKQALRWVQVLAEHEGEWISAPELKRYDPELDGCRPDRHCKRYLPDKILALIETDCRKGSRLSLP